MLHNVVFTIWGYLMLVDGNFVVAHLPCDRVYRERQCFILQTEDLGFLYALTLIAAKLDVHARLKHSIYRCPIPRVSLRMTQDAK